MKLYRKQLNSLDELQREKIKLRYQRMHLDKLHEDIEEGRKETAGTPGLMGTLLELAMSSGGLDTAIQVGSQLMGRFRQKRRKRKLEAQFGVHIPKQKSTTRKIAEDVLISYVVGKAVRMSIGLLRQNLKKKKGPRI